MTYGYPFIHSFIQHIFTEHILCVRVESFRVTACITSHEDRPVNLTKVSAMFFPYSYKLPNS